MALDNAQFISELSITDPPGTDAIAEGDDHIRTVKRATQQSFPNVNAAVPQTAAQMGQMAIKSEVNTFISGQIFTDLLNVDGFGISPAHYQFTQSGVPTWQIRAFNTSDDLLFTRFQAGVFVDNPIIIDNLNGRARFNAITFFNAELRAFAGSAAFPPYTFEGDPTLGMYHLALNILGWSIAGVERMRLSATGITYLTPNFRIGVSDTGAGSSKLEMGLLSDNSGFVQGRTLSGDNSWLLRSDVNGQSFVAAFASGGKFGIRTSTPLRTLHVAGEGATGMRITGLPTSPSGLAGGDIWNSGGFLAIV